MNLKYALTTEKSVAAIEKENKITFIVEAGATKKDIRKEAEETYKEKVKKITVSNLFSGKRKASVSFVKKGAAADIAAKLKII